MIDRRKKDRVGDLPSNDSASVPKVSFLQNLSMTILILGSFFPGNGTPGSSVPGCNPQS